MLVWAGVKRDLPEIFERAFDQLCPRFPMPDFHVEFFPFSGLNNTIRLRGERVLVRISDLLGSSSRPVLDAIAHILVAKLYRCPVDPAQAMRYRRYVNRRDVSEQVHRIRQVRGRKRIAGARGHHYDLESVFADLNQRFFHGLLGRPRLTWSQGRARNSLGHYDPAHNTIVVSRVFDSPRVPRCAVQYLVFHEMLHLRHPVSLRGSRRCVHPPAFQAEENRFPHLAQAKRFLRSL